MLIDTHLRPRRLRPLLETDGLASFCVLGVAGIVGSILLGILTYEKAEYAAVAVVAIVLAIAAWRLPRTILILAVVSYVWAPGDILSGFGNYPQAQKLLILFAGLLLGSRRGFRPMFALPVFAYILVALLSALGGTPAAGLTVYQTFLSLLTLTVCWIAFSVRWRRDDAIVVLKVLAWLPLASLLLGLVLYAAHRTTVIDTVSHPPRLQGALIAPYLAAAAAAGTAAALVLYRTVVWRYGATLIVLNATALALTVTRGAMIAGGLALVPSVVRLARSWVRVRTPGQLLRLLLALALAAAFVVFVATQVETRDSQSIFVPGQGEIKGDASSGRTAAWAFAYERAKVNLIFGRGIGSAPVIGAQYQHFLAQHNEYLRMLLEGGYVGGIIILASLLGVVALAISRAPRVIRIDLIAFGIGVLIYSFTDNTLSNPQFALPMTLIFSFAAALGTRAATPASTQRPLVPV